MIDTYTLSNGLRLIMERMPHLRSTSIGVWVKAGSMLEKQTENGISHLMEHMAFKGTQRRSARELAEEMDAIGGHMNAATSKLYTAYYAKVCDSDLEKAADILADIVCHPLITQEDLEKEKSVITEEIAMVDDYPEENVFDLLHEALYHGQALAMPIIGTREGVLGYARQQVVDYRKAHYNADNTVISVAGSFKREELISILEDKFSGWERGEAAEYPLTLANASPSRLYKDKKSEQTHICLGYAGLPQGDKRRYTMMVFNTIFGGGVSSRLFQKVREELALVYSIYSSPSAYPGCGDFTVYSAATPKNSPRVISQIFEEADKLIQKGVSEKELAQAKAQLRTSFVLSQESAYARMSYLGTQYLLDAPMQSPAQTLRGIERVTEKMVIGLAREIFSQSPSMAVVGKGSAKLLK